MIVVVATESDLVLQIECTPDDTVANLKGRLIASTGLQPAEQALYFKGSQLRDGLTVGAAGISDNDMLMLQHVPGGGAARQSAVPGSIAGQTPQALIEGFRNNPELLARLEALHPGSTEAIRSNNGQQIEMLLRLLGERAAGREQELEQLSGNQMDPESQKKIEEMIRKRNINENYTQAFEHMPELFTSVTMLYVHMEVNGIAVQAFVDTGAQMTIMTQSFAERCSLTRLIDDRCGGMAHGVGQSRLIGRVHSAPLKVGNEIIASSIMVLEQTSGPPFIFGLDNLIRHQCVVDLKSMKLHIGAINVEIPFLLEHQIDQSDRLFATQGSTSNEQQQQGATVADASAFPEEKIARLVSLGFDRQQSIAALEASNGNEEMAASLLLG